MAFNHEYPYTDPYRYNEDWILQEIINLKEKCDDLQEQINKLKEKK